MQLKPVVAAAVAALALGVASSSQACFTVIVGKNLSDTGDIIVGHNEDNDGRIMSSQYWVPPATHKAGEMIDFEPSAAKIPQVEKTNGFWWQQTLHPLGYSYSDGFFNDKGVLITSNNCGDTIEKGEATKDGGIGYGIRRLVAERANSAREGVKLAIDLATKYGYNHQGRTYTIADKNEAWQVAIMRGGRHLARKVKDNEMTMMSNVFSLANVDLNDKENVIASPDLVQHAIEKGTYKPAKAGDYSDFNFRNAYHTPDRMEQDWNILRVREAIKHLLGKDYEQPYNHPETFTINPGRKISAADVRDILRLNNSYQERNSGWQHEQFTDPSNGGTFDSAVYVLTQNPLTSYTWRTSGRPDSQFSYPQFLLGKPAQAQSYMDAKAGTHAQFRSVPADFDYTPDRTVFTFVNHQNFLDWNRPELRKFAATQKAYEAAAAEELATVLENAKAVAAVNPEKAVEKMHEFNVHSFEKVLGATAAELMKNNKHAIIIDKATLSQGDKGNVKVTLLSDKDLDATKIDKGATFFGDGYPDEDINYNDKRAQPVAIEFVDVNNDGRKDAVIEFPVKGATTYTVPGVNTQLYLWTKADGKPIMAFDTVKIEK